MQTSDDGALSSVSSMANAIDLQGLADISLLILAGVSAAATVAVLIGLFVVAPITFVTNSIRACVAWSRRTDWKWLRSLLLVMLMLAAIGAMTFLGARAIYHADPVAELLLISLAGLLVIVGGALILWRLAGTAKRSMAKMIQGKKPKPEEPVARRETADD